MAELSAKEYWLLKEIEEEFRESVDQRSLYYYMREKLPWREMAKLEKFSLFADELVYSMLYHVLTKHSDWVQVLLKACDDLGLKHVEKLVKKWEMFQDLKMKTSTVVTKEAQVQDLKMKTSTVVTKEAQVQDLKMKTSTVVTKEAQDTTDIPGPSTDFEKTNAKFACLCQLMMTVCADLFWDVLDYYIQLADVKTQFFEICRNLESIMNFKQVRNCCLLEITEPWGDATLQTIKDISLLYILIRFTCNIPPPQTGWGSRPEDDDKSLAGCIERIRILGKTILDHSEETKETLESDFKDILKNLRTNISEIQKMVFKKDSYAQAVDELFSLDIKRSKRYINDFKNLKSEEDTISPFAVIQYYPDRETENLFRVYTLIDTISSNLFRDTLCRFVNPASLEFGNHIAEVLPTNRLLFFYNFLRKTCGISQHKCGWGFLPDTNDHSLAACIDRLMIQRNAIAASMKRGISESNFQQIWPKLRDDIIEIEQQVIGGNSYEQRMQDLFSMPINQVFAVGYVAENVHAMSYWDLSRDDNRKGMPEESSLSMKPEDSETGMPEESSLSMKPEDSETGDVFRSPPVLSREQAELLKSIEEIIVQTFPNESFVGDIFEEKCLTLVGKEIKSLSKEVTVIHNPDIYQRFKPGALLIYEVEVAFQNGDFNITKENPISAKNFLMSRRDYNPRVILVKSDPALKEYAKSFVFRKYRDVISLGNTFVQHETDGDCHFSKLSGLYSASFICDQIRLITEVNPPESILFDDSIFFSRKFISQICYGVILKNDNLDVGSVEHATYLSKSDKCLNQLRQNLEEQTIQKICSSLKFKHNMGCITSHILEKILLKAVADLRSEEIDSCKAKVALPVDVNSKEWRLGVAEALHTLIIEKMYFLTKQFKVLYQELQSNLKRVCARIESYKNLCHQNSLSEYVSNNFPYDATQFQRSLGPQLCIIEQFPIQTEFIKNLLDAVSFKKELSKMHAMALSERVEIPEIETLHIYYVNVVYEEDRLEVRENNHLQKEQFFSAKAERIIWIRSKSVPVIDAKLCVYQKYQDNIKSGNIWIHHEYDGNVDEIRKLCVIQKLESLSRNVLSVCDIVKYFQWADLRGTLAEIFSAKNVHTSCETVFLHTNYLSGADEDKMKQKYSNEVKKYFGLQILIKLFTFPAERAERIPHGWEGRVLTIPPSSLESTALAFFPAIEKLMPSALIDINTMEYHMEFAHAFYISICQKQKYVFDEIKHQFKSVLNKNIIELYILDGCIKSLKRRLALLDQEKLVEEWKKRKVIQNKKEVLSEFPSILTMIAGERDGNSVIKVFLRENGKIPSEEQLRKMCSIFPNVQIHFANVSEEQNKNAQILKKKKENKKMYPLSKDERITLDDMQKKIKMHHVILMANHSNLVGIGVSRVLNDDIRFGQPCIVLHCIDKTIIPFGECTLPMFLEGYPVEVKTSLFTLGHCKNCPALNAGCSIGIHGDKESAGSVGFFVRNRMPPKREGFLTCAHVACSKTQLESLYNSTTVLCVTEEKDEMKNYEIVHPSSKDSNTAKVIGTLKKACYGNFSKENDNILTAVGIDAAYITSTSEKIGEIISLQTVDEKDLHLFVTRVMKDGRTTGHTTGLLSEIGIYRMFDDYLPNTRIYFQDCYKIDDEDTIFSRSGDSGSGVLTEETSKALGLLIAKSEISPESLVCDIQKIVDIFDLDLYHWI